MSWDGQPPSFFFLLFSFCFFSLPCRKISPVSLRPFLSAEDICQEQEGTRADAFMVVSPSGAVGHAMAMGWAPGTTGHRSPCRAARLARLELPTPSSASPGEAAHGTSLHTHGRCKRPCRGAAVHSPSLQRQAGSAGITGDPTAAARGARRAGCWPSSGEGSSLGKWKPEWGLLYLF